MVNQSGIGGDKGGLPVHSIDFVCKTAEDPSAEIRKMSTAILKLMQEKGAR